MTQMNQTRIDYVNVLIVGIVIFIAGIIIGAILFPTGSIFGMSATGYDYVLAVTSNATNQTEGYNIEKYIQILTNATEYTGLGEEEEQ